MSVKIYTTSTCAYCRAEKAWLDENKVEYEQVNVEASQALAEELMKLSGGQSVPFTVISKTGQDDVKILGFDQPKLASALGIS